MVVGTGIRGKVEMEAHEVLEVEELADEHVGNVLNMNVKVKESEDKRVEGRLSVFLVEDCWHSNFQHQHILLIKQARLCGQQFIYLYLIFCSQQFCSQCFPPL